MNYPKEYNGIDRPDPTEILEEYLSYLASTGELDPEVEEDLEEE